jgi:metal transporter CNNM
MTRINKLALAGGLILFNKMLMFPRLVRGAQLLMEVHKDHGHVDDSGSVGDISHGTHDQSHGGGHALDPAFSGAWWFDAFVAIFCTVTSAFMSGLTVGLIGLDKLTLEINATTDPVAKKRADIILPVTSKHHWMLVTLMFINAIVMETLPIYVDKMVPELLAISICVFLELIAGEVIPMAVCSGPKQVQIAEMCAPGVNLLMWLTSPVSWPIGQVLDKLLGEHTVDRFNNAELKALIMLHSE